VNPYPVSPLVFDLVSPEWASQAGSGLFADEYATRLTVDQTGIRVDYGPKKSDLLQWDDPKFQFVLLDFRQVIQNHPVLDRNAPPFQFRYSPEGKAFAIPEAAFDALNGIAQSAGLIRHPSQQGRTIPAGTKMFHWARSPVRWWE
jgi:hypothetical protein